jgi:hypothetical protein
MKKLKHQWLNAKEMTQQDINEALGLENRTIKYNIFRVIKNLFYIWYLEYQSTICKHKGHRLLVETQAGPESGSDYIECTRCGWSHEHIYY